MITPPDQPASNSWADIFKWTILHPSTWPVLPVIYMAWEFHNSLADQRQLFYLLLQKLDALALAVNSIH